MIYYTLPPSLDDDIFRFQQDLAEFKAGRLHETAFTAKRLKMGIYLERNRSTYMCRIRCSGNIITPKQLAGVASLARIYGNGKVHLTTRAEVQVHRIEERNLISVLRKLREIKLSCKGGGNTVRNIIANHDSGISSEEVFDVQPCLLALTERLIGESDSWDLPRKIKIAFSSLAEETAFGFIQDVSFIAHLNPEGKQGFRVYVGGGMGAHPQVAVQLHEFVHQEDVYNVVRAVKNIFHRYGNRRNKYRNRIKFLLHEELGISAFRTYYRQELNQVLEQGYPNLTIKTVNKDEKADRDISLVPEQEDSDDFQIWKKRHVLRQRQKGLCQIKLPLFSGNIQAEDCSALEKFLRPFGENSLRVGTDQNLYLINIPKKFLTNIYKEIRKYQTLSDRPMFYGNLVACAGSQGCQVGITDPRAASKAVFNYFDTVATADFCPPSDIIIRISGCPNACTNHWIADLSFYGKARQVDGHPVPAYNVLGNGGMYGGTLRIAEKIGWIHAYDLPRFITEVMRRYAHFKEQSEQRTETGSGVDFHDYWRSGGKDIMTELCASCYNDIPTFAEDKNYYFDHGADRLFSVKDIGHEECSAGIYDIINVDDKIIRKNLLHLAAEKNINDTALEDLLNSTLLHAARMLIVTRGEEAKNDAEVYSLFIRYFLDTGLISAAHRPLLSTARHGNTTSLYEKKEQVVAFAEEVTTLYRNMDNTMRFPGEQENMVLNTAKLKDAQPVSAAQARRPDRFKNLSGMKYPLNFAQIRVQLFAMHPGETLEVILDDGAPLENVSESVRSEGHSILYQEKNGDHWSLLIQKA